MNKIKTYKIFESDLKKINSFYKSYIRNKDDYAKVGWQSVNSQQKRFEILLKIGVQEGETILDYGCGVGDLFGYILDKYDDLKYIGVDINPKMIKYAKSKYPSADFKLINDIEDVNFNYDWFLASGVFTVYTPFNEMLRIIDAGYRKSSNGVAFNLLEDYFASNDDSSYTRGYNKKQVMNALSKKYSDIKIVDGYLYNDWSVYIKK